VIKRLGFPDLSWANPLLKPGAAATSLAMVAFGSMVIGFVMTVRTGKWLPRVLLIAGALVWPLPDHPWQGPVAIKLSYLHGIHVADLLSVIAIIAAVVPWRRRQSKISSTADQEHEH
jgi:hypothetical protein